MTLSLPEDTRMAAAHAEERRPNFQLPRNSCDAHCHVFGPAAVFPYAPTRRYTPEDAPKEALAALHERLGVERAVIVQASCHGTDNRAMIDAIASAPDRFRGVAIIDDSFTEADYARLHDGGVRGARFNFVKHLGGTPDMERFHRLVDRIAALDMGWHVVLHLDADDIVPLRDMMRALPLPFVIDHMGRVDALQGPDQPAFAALLELVRLERCWIKVCGSERIAPPPFEAAIPIARALIEASGTRVMWGTDFPHPNPKYPVEEADLVDLLPRFAPDPAMLHKVLVENPARLYGFPEA